MAKAKIKPFAIEDVSKISPYVLLKLAMAGRLAEKEIYYSIAS